MAYLEDLGSRNGTVRGGETLQGRVVLSDGDEIRLGTVLLVYRAGSTEASTQGSPAPPR